MPAFLFPARTASPLIAGVLLALACLSSGSAAAADNDSVANARAQYEKDKAACLDNAKNRDVNACLRDAGATYQSRIRGKQASQPAASNSNFSENAMARCSIFSGEDRSQCERRITDGPVDGSVGKGGVLYEATVREIVSQQNP